MPTSSDPSPVGPARAFDPGRYRVRPFEDGDFAAKERIDRETDPEVALSAEETRHLDERLRARPGALCLRLAVEERPSGVLVADGVLQHRLHAFHPQEFFVEVQVARAHRRRGIGGMLYDRLESEARSRRATCLRSGGHEDDPGCLHLLDRCGFAPVRRTWASRADLGEGHAARLVDRTRELAAKGIEVRSYAEEPFDTEAGRRRLHALEVVAARDVPRAGQYTPSPYEEFVAQELVRPGHFPAASFAARLGDRYLAMTTVERDLARPDTLRVGFTGTDPEFRRLGLATEVKRRSALAARAAGFRHLTTFNDSTNRPIWAINEKLGFRPVTTWVLAEKRLAVDGAT
jgi:mycothiol synthase